MGRPERARWRACGAEGFRINAIGPGPWAAAARRRQGLRPKGAKGRKTLEREKAKKIAAARAELAKIDYAAAYDSLDILEKVMRRFYLRGPIEEKMGAETDWKAADAAFVQAAAIAEKVRRSIGMLNSRQSVSPATSTPP
jgi:hypothetical protein